MSDHPFIQALLLKLGIDPDTTKACNISIGPGPVEVMLVYYPRLKEGMGMPAEKRFYLKEIDDDE